MINNLTTEPIQNWTFLPGNSVFIKNFISKSIADYLFDALEIEIKYITRGELKFKAPNGQDIPLPRLKQFYGTIKKSGDYPIYRYGLNDYPKTNNWPPILKIVRDMLEQECNQNCNHTVCNKYETNTDYIGYHHDKTNSLTPGSKVIVLSLGQTRRMDIQILWKENNKKKTKKIASIDMIHGSLFELTLETNKNHKHQIKKEKLNKKTRLGLTFRSVCEFVNIKTGNYYFEKIPLHSKYKWSPKIE